MSVANVWTFFYGGLMNPSVMQALGMSPTGREIGFLPGYELSISPLVNLAPKVECVCYGVFLQVTHFELDHVYGQLKAKYLPFPIVGQDLHGRSRPALCYIAPAMPHGQAEEEHVLNLLRPAEKLGFPEWYLNRIRSFLPR